MANLITVRLNRGDASSWGFRLQGGKDFGTPLVIQKIMGGSPAERAGLIAGDTVVKINNVDVYNLRHKDAQDVILRAGSSFDVAVHRGGSTWKPSVTAVGAISTPRPAAPVHTVSPVTATSLAAGNQTSIDAIGTTHNLSARPFQVNGGPRLVNKQYNSPLPIYSDRSIAETLSAQSEVLSNGVLGVNFKKNEKSYDASNSEVFRMVQEHDKGPRDYESVTRSDFYATHSHAVGGHTQRRGTPTRDQSQSISPQGTGSFQPEPEQKSSNAANQQMTKCTDCQRVIVGVFVRIKDKNLHVECFKCSTCGTSLKNVGYYNLNNKLYCDVHAKLAARNHPPAPNLQPVTVPPGGRIPTGTISAALASHSLPSPAPLSPLSPNINYSAAPFQPGASFSSPRPFSSVSAPLSPSSSTLPKLSPTPAAPLAGRYSSIKPSAPFRGTGGGRQAGAIGVAPKRGRGILNLAATPGSRVPLCGQCHSHIRGPFVTALGKIWCPDHFICATPSCKRPLHDLGFVEERGQLYCEYCFEQYLAPPCAKCNSKVKGDCLKAIGKTFHPECFSCVYCSKLFGNSPFFLEDAQPYCEADWNELFTTKCFACGFPVEAGDRWVEALNNNYHSQCFNCTMCKKNLEGQSFFAKGGRPFCKNHAR